MNINGGALEFEIVAKTGQLNTALEQSKKMISDFATTAKKGGADIDTAMQKTAEQIEKAFADIDTMSGLNQQEIKKLQKAYDELGKRAGDAFMKGTKAGDQEFSQLQARQQEIKREITIRQQLEAEIAKTADKLAAENASFEKQREQLQQAANAHTSLRTQLRQVVEQLAVMEEAGERGSEAYRKLQEEAGRLKNAMGDAQQQATILAHDNAGLQGVISAVSGVAGVMSAAQGAVGLFAGENENLQKIMVKVQSLMAVTMGLQQAANTLNKDSYFRVVLLSKAQAGLAAVNTRLSASFVKLGLSATAANVATKALMATCTLGLSLAIAGVVALIEKLRKKQDEARATQEKLREEQEKAQESLKKIADSYGQQVAEIDALRAALKSENYSQQEKEKIIRRLQSIMPDYTASLDAEGRVIRENTAAIDNYTASLEKSLKFKAAMEELTELYSKLYQQEKNKPEQKTRQQYIEDTAKATGISMSEVTPQMQEVWGKQFDAMGKISSTFWQQETDKIKADINKVMSYITDSGLGDFLSGGTSGGNGGDGGSTKDPFLEMLNQRKAQYSTYTKWISSGDEIVRKAASTQFAGLLQEGATYLDYLKNQRDAIISSVGGDTSKLDATATQNLVNLNNEIATESKNTILADFEAALNTQLAGASSVLDMLDIIAAKRKEIKGDEYEEGKGGILDKAKEKTDETKNSTLQALLQQYAQHLSEKAQFDATYNANKQLLEQQAAAATNEAEKAMYEEALKQMAAKKAEYEKQLSPDVAALMNSAEWAQLFGNFDDLTTKQLDNLITKIESQKAQLGAEMKPEDLQAVLDKLKAAKKEVETRNPFKALSTALKDYKNEASKANLSATFSALGGSLNLVKGAFDAVTGALQNMGVGSDAVTSDLLSDIGNMVGAAGDLAMGIATGNPLQIIQGAISLISSALEVFNVQDRRADYDIQRHATSLKNLQAEYNKLQNAIKHALGSDYYKASQDAIKNLRKQADDLAAMRAAEAGKKKSDAEKVADYDQQIEENAEATRNAIEQLSADITQTTAKDLAGELGDAIAQAFTDGFSSAAVNAAIDDVVNKVIKDAVLNALKVQFLEKPLKDAIAQLQAAMGFDAEGNGSWDGLTAEEQQAFRDRVKQIAGTYTEAMKAYEDLFKELEDAAGEDDPSSLSGAIKGASQESIDLLAGQTNAVRVNQVESLNILRQSLLHLASIDNKMSINNQLLSQIYTAVKNTDGSLRAVGITF